MDAAHPMARCNAGRGGMVLGGAVVEGCFLWGGGQATTVGLGGVCLDALQSDVVDVVEDRPMKEIRYTKTLKLTSIAT